MNKFNQYEQHIPLLFRIVLGTLWVWMGIVPKLLFPEPRVMMVSKSWVAPFLPFSPETFIVLLAVVEIVTGLMLLLGLYTELASWIQIGLIAMIIIGLWNIAAAQGITSPLAHLLMKDIPLATMNLTLIILGAGKYSLDFRRKGVRT